MKNYFSILQLEPSFTLDEDELQRSYVKLQQEHHPDKQIGKSEAERTKAFQLSMDINDAYEVLKSPLTRAQHLLELQNIFVNSEDDNVKPSAELLMNNMELRESIMEASDHDTLAEIELDCRNQARKVSHELQKQFEAANYDEAAQSTIKLRYLYKTLEEIRIRQYSLAS